MSGVELFDSLADIRERWPIIFLTGHGEVHGQCSQTSARLISSKSRLLTINYGFGFRRFAPKRATFECGCSVRSHQTKIDSLSAREPVMEAVLDGYTNREAADSLDMAVRTVEIHRANRMKKWVSKVRLN